MNLDIDLEEHTQLPFCVHNTEVGEVNGKSKGCEGSLFTEGPPVLSLLVASLFLHRALHMGNVTQAASSPCPALQFPLFMHHDQQSSPLWGTCGPVRLT